MNLRLYQLEALQATRNRRDAGVTRQCVVLPTGTGKAVILASLPSAHVIDMFLVRTAKALCAEVLGA